MHSINTQTTTIEPYGKKKKSYLVCVVTKIDCLAIAVLFVAFLAGGFSLSRIDLRFRELGWLDNVAYWFLLPLFLLGSMILYKNRVHYRPVCYEKKILSNFREFVFFVIMLNCYMALSAIWAPVPNIEQSINILLVSFYIALAYGFIRGNPKRNIIVVIELTFWAGIVYALEGMLSSGLEAQRMAAFGGGPNVFVRVVGGGLIAGLYLYFVRGRRLVILSFPVLVIALVASGSRGGVIGMMLSSIFMWMFVMPRYIKWRMLLSSAVLICLVFWIGFSLINTSSVASLAKERYYDRTIETQYLSGRDECFSDAIRIFQSNMLIGAGLDSFHLHSKSGIYPHNIILHIGAEGGMIGLSLLFFCIFLVVKRWFKPRNEENEFVLILCLLYFFSSLISGGIYDARFIWLYGMLYMVPPTLHKKDEGHLAQRYAF